MVTSSNQPQAREAASSRRTPKLSSANIRGRQDRAPRSVLQTLHMVAVPVRSGPQRRMMMAAHTPALITAARCASRHQLACRSTRGRHTDKHNHRAPCQWHQVRCSTGKLARIAAIASTLALASPARRSSRGPTILPDTKTRSTMRASKKCVATCVPMKRLSVAPTLLHDTTVYATPTSSISASIAGAVVVRADKAKGVYCSLARRRLALPFSCRLVSAWPVRGSKYFVGKVRVTRPSTKPARSYLPTQFQAAVALQFLPGQKIVGSAGGSLRPRFTLGEYDRRGGNLQSEIRDDQIDHESLAISLPAQTQPLISDHFSWASDFPSSANPSKPRCLALAQPPFPTSVFPQEVRLVCPTSIITSFASGSRTAAAQINKNATTDCLRRPSAAQNTPSPRRGRPGRLARRRRASLQ